MKLAYLATAAVLATTAAAAPVDTAAFTARQLAPSNGLWYQMRGIDIIGKDTTNVINVKTPIECFIKCFTNVPAASKQCSAVSWVSNNGGTCYLKGADFKGTPSTPKSEVDSFLILEDSKSDVIVSGTSVNVDMPGNDLDNSGGKDMNTCRNQCVANKACYAVVWTDYKNGWCWLKSRASTFVPKAGAQSAYIARKFGILDGGLGGLGPILP